MSMARLASDCLPEQSHGPIEPTFARMGQGRASPSVDLRRYRCVQGRLDEHLRPSDEAFAVARDGKGRESLVERLAALAGATLPLAVVNPRQIRDFAGRSESSPRPTLSMRTLLPCSRSGSGRSRGRSPRRQTTARRKPSCRTRKPPPCCSWLCWLLARSRCARWTAGRASPRSSDQIIDLGT